MIMESKTVLMCGGPADGRWVVVEGRTETQRVMTLPRLDFSAPPEAETALTYVDYRIMPLSLLGHQMWIGVAVDEAYDDRAIMKAVLQRDVAAHLGAYR